MNQASLGADLARLGLREGDHVLVHMSLRKVGQVEGGPLAVISALRDVVGDAGTVVFPAHTGHGGCSPANPPPFDARYTPSIGMGIVAETARQLPEAVRSLSPTHSVSAIGRLAEWLCEAHRLAETPCGVESPYERLARVNGRILLLGCDHENNTSIHGLEESAQVPYHMLPGAATYTIIDQQGRPIEITARFHRWGDVRDFEVVEPVLLQAGAQTNGPAGQAVGRLVSSAQLVSLILPLLIEDPTLLLAKPHPTDTLSHG